jgi:ubiquinone/menaquinone biosynthesis C-methylase UbiE
MRTSKIELLSCKILAENEQVVNDIDLVRKGLFKDIGWHYYVDLVWVISWLQKMEIKPGATILDAGAGNGLLQYLLSYYGYNVLSVDFSPRRTNPLTILQFRIEKKKSTKVFSDSYISHMRNLSNFKFTGKKLGSFIKNGQLNIMSMIKLFVRIYFGRSRSGKILLYQADMRNMNEIPENTIDAIVSVSAIEHLEFDSIKLAINEFTRVLKQNHPMIISTSASKYHDWYHQPSQGWCLSLETLSSLFAFGDEYANAFDDFDDVMSEYRNNSFLKEHMASIYRISRNNGMPEGVWEPEYIPVGIVTTKNEKSLLAGFSS